MPFSSTIIAPQGIIRDASPDNVTTGAWNDAENMRFGESSTNKVTGYVDLAGATVIEPERLQSLEELGDFWWLYYGPDGVGVWDGIGAHSDITPVGYTPSLRDHWTVTKLNGVAVGNHETEGPYFWDFNVANPMALLPGWPNGVSTDPTWRCKIMRSFKFNLFALAMTEDGVEVDDAFRWSGSAAPGTLSSQWLPTAANDAGSLSVGGTRGTIIDAIPLRDSLLVFKLDSTYAVLPVGGGLVYGQRETFSTVGMLATGCGIEFRGRALVLTDQDVIMTDGVEAESIIDERNRKALFNEMDADLFDRAFVARDPASQSIAIFIPSVNHPNPSEECNLAYIYDPTANEWSVRRPFHTMSSWTLGSYRSDANAAWDLDSQAWDLDGTSWADADPSNARLATVSFAESRIYGFAGNHLRDDDEPIVAFAEKTGIQLGDIAHASYMNQIWVSADGSPGTKIKVEAGGHDQGVDAPVYTAVGEVEVGVSKQLTLEAQGRYLAIRFTSVGDEAFRVNQFRLNWRDGPRYAV